FARRRVRGPERRRHRDVLDRREMRERPRNLVGARDTEAGDLVRAVVGQSAWTQVDRPAIGLVVAADDVDQRRLAGAIRSDEADDLTGRDAQADATEGLDASERLPDLAAFQWRRCDGVTRRRSMAVEMRNGFHFGRALSTAT